MGKERVATNEGEWGNGRLKSIYGDHPRFVSACASEKEGLSFAGLPMAFHHRVTTLWPVSDSHWAKILQHSLSSAQPSCTASQSFGPRLRPIATRPATLRPRQRDNVYSWPDIAATPIVHLLSPWPCRQQLFSMSLRQYAHVSATWP
jgi:hypothetical protein